MEALKLGANKTGLILGLCLGAWHAAWSLLVAVGWAKVIFEWILWLHFLNNPFEIAPFSLLRAASLILTTALIGYVMGCVFAFVWNAFQNKRRSVI